MVNPRRDTGKLQGEARRREKDNVFGQGTKEPIVVSILVKLPTHTQGHKGIIHYHDIGDYLTRDQKLKAITDFQDISAISWQSLTPDEHGDWLNQRNSEFEAFIPLAEESKKKGDFTTQSFFIIYSRGLETARDAWIYNFNLSVVLENMKRTLAFYNNQVKKFEKTKKFDEDPTKISWSRSWRQYAQNGKVIPFTPARKGEVSYRPFCKVHAYLGDYSINVWGQCREFFPSGKYKNIVICVTDSTALITDAIPDKHFVGDVQAFPLYWYEKREKKGPQLIFSFDDGGDEYIRHDGISDFILKQFQSAIGSRITKEDIFYFVYGALHHRGYREKFAADLKKQLPRLPVPVSTDDYRLMVKVGRELAQLHLHYEDIEGYALREVQTSLEVNYTVRKLAWGKKNGAEDRTKMIVNETLTLEGIPAKAHQYVVNGRTPLEWIIDRYQIRTDKESGICNDPNDWGKEHGNPRYIVDLIKSVTTVSVKTVDLMTKLDAIKMR